MMRTLLYPFYWCAPYAAVYQALFYPNFKLDRVISFTVLLVAIRLMAANLKDAQSAMETANVLKGITSEFKLVTFETNMFKGNYSEQVPRLKALTKARGLPARPYGYDPSLLLLRSAQRRLVVATSKCHGQAIYEYTCMANRQLSLIFLPESSDEIASDPVKKFAVYHELAHTHRANISIFEREKFEVHMIALFLFLMILGVGVGNLTMMLVWGVPFTILGLEICGRSRYNGRLAAEILADNLATRIAFLVDPPLFETLPNIRLPNDRALDKNQLRTRRRRFRATLSKYHRSGQLDLLFFGETVPNVLVYFYFLCLTILVGIAGHWGRNLDDGHFKYIWIFVIGSVGAYIWATVATRGVRRLLMERIVGTETFPDYAP